MAESVELLRKANARQAGRAIGQDPNQPKSMAVSLKAQGHHSDILGLPEQPGGVAALQVTNPTDPDFGKFIFMAGYSVPGGGDVIR